jgi:hydroxymethylglutaryl-CoA lyase
MKIIECPRDAMQGIKQMIPTEDKARYINALLDVGFDTIDFGSFVSPKAIPQMADTSAVLSQLAPINNGTNLLAIVANLRGALDTLEFDRIDYLGFPLSLSETFQVRNTNKSIKEAFSTIDQIQQQIADSNKKLVVYLSMGFGNPYGDPYSPEYVKDFVRDLKTMNISVISLADTIGIAEPALIQKLLSELIQEFPTIEFGAHLHSTPFTSIEKIHAVLQSKCQRLDGALMGYGGCPMAKDDLTGNLDTLKILEVLKPDIDLDALQEAKKIASELFNRYH